MVCRQLGFTGAGTQQYNCIFGHGNGPIWMDKVQCIGTEASLDDCRMIHLFQLTNGQMDCLHIQDVCIMCNPESMFSF